MAHKKYKAFISYSHADESWARWLHNALETYRIPKRLVQKHSLANNHLTPIFRDRDELASSGNLSDVIQQAMADSEYLIVICSQHSAQSRWVNEEVKKFKMLGRSNNVLCLLIDKPECSFPANTLVDFNSSGDEISSNIEPLAADARAGFDGKAMAKLKIISGMINVGLDELIRRDAIRGQKRMMAIAAASVIGMAVTSFLSFYALEQRDFARQQQALSVIARDEAIASKDVAVKAKTEAEKVANFLVGMFELFDPRESLGNAVTAHDVINRAKETAQSDLVEQPLTQAKLLYTLGSVYQALGLYSEARNVKNDAYRIRQQHLGDKHADTLASLDDLANIALHQGDYLALEKYAIESLLINRKLHGDKSIETIDALSNMSSAMSKLGKDKLAVEYSEEVLRNARITPEVTPKKLELYIRRAANQISALGDYQRAEPLYKESLALSRKVYGEVAPNVAFALDNLGIHYTDMERFDLAEPLYWQSLEMLQQIFGKKHPEVAQTMGNIASFLITSDGDHEKARELLINAIEIDREVRPNHEFIGNYLWSLALLDVAQKDFSAAESNWRESLQVLSHSFAAFDPIVLGVHAGLARTLLAQNKLKEAESILAKCYAELIKLNNKNDILIEVLEDLIVVYERTDQPDRAAELWPKLDSLYAVQKPD
ncbi:toll/interleukin-1 receptor domain-containing protein [uncultured Paraglaciecola sp.]|uniref:toll/interleukin-1 receptor domain-containing protein n=1 Tax=uncultured Paraglaciecola sp. TaxID=1765024 RepID=UPI0026307BD7|nr:toll/interleukin-1 receptor domain-containing protein [uncultured Paraglaciecola sp.]